MAHKVFRAVSISHFERETEQDALRDLDAIRNNYPQKDGWKEIRGFVEKLPNGNFRAIRQHAQHK